MRKTTWLSAAALLLAPSLALAQQPAGGCAEVPGQGMQCSVLFTFKGGLELPSISTVANLPTCNAAAQGQLRMVSDATTPAYNATIVGGGAVITLVACDGTNWKAH